MMSADGAEDLATMDILTLEDTDINIFVGNLAFTTTEQELRQLFEPYGTVDTIRIMTDRDTGRSRGFGFIEMPDCHAAQDAIAGLNGTPLAGRTLTVNEARPREPRREPRQPRW
jgi:RNA recognition motif-containing protein